MKKWVFLLMFGFLVFGCGDDPPTSDCPDGECCVDCLPEICTNGVRDAVETDVDCGGVCGATCELGAQCSADEDCVQSSCRGRCVDPNAPEPQCREDDECESGVCEGGMCQNPTCEDGIRNGSETGTDCGGNCPGCPDFSGCMVGSDCASGFCIEGGCRSTPCGNGVVDLGEACDDGNLRDGDNCSADCQMVTCKVGEDLVDLQAGIDSGCETILIGEGVFAGDVVIDRPVQIFGDGAEVTEIRGSGVGPALTVTTGGSVHLGFLRITEGRAERGAGIFHTAGALTLQEIEVRDNIATLSGGGLHSEGGNVSIVESLFDGNHVLVPQGSGQIGCGGAITTIGVGIDVESLEIRANRVVHSGAGIARGAGLCLLDSRLGAEKLHVNLNQIELNSMEVGEVLAQGSGLYANNSELLIIGESSFSGNSILGTLPMAEGHVEGGLIHTEGGQHIFDTMRIEDSIIALESNGTTLEGGVIWTRGATWNVFNVAIDGVDLGRAATLRGGIIFGDGTLELNRVFVSDVSAEADQMVGAFIWFTQGSTESALSVFRSEFKGTSLTTASSSGFFVEAANSGDSITVEFEESGAYDVVGSGSGAMIQAVSNDGATVLVDVINSTLAGEGEVAVDASGAGVCVVRLFNATLKGAVKSTGAATQFQPGNSIIDADPACVLDGAAMVSRGFNLMVGQGCNAVPSDLVGIPASLAPLAYNDSDTMTFSPQAFSLAINAGNPAGCSGPDGNQLVVDQRGKPRTDARCDIGAHEAP